jgi:hypothetical protein
MTIRCHKPEQNLRRSSVFTTSLSVLALSLSLACNNTKNPGDDKAERDPITGLTVAEAKEVLVEVGDRSITLGDYVATLLRMDRFERLRYQSEEKQKQLLDEMIEVELLAQEARRRGLDKDPEVELMMDQALRDELLRQIEAELPQPEEIGEREVRDYFEKHHAEFKEPERRRVLAIRVGSREAAEKVLLEAKDVSGQKWGELAEKHSSDRSKVGKREANELAGDLGFVAAPGQKRGTNEAVPDPVRAAVFTVDKVGDVVDQVVEAEKNFYVVRLGGLSPSRDRSLKDAERTIRIELRRQLFLQAEKDLEAKLRKKYPVVINEAALMSAPTKAQESPPSPSAQP